MYIWCIFHRTDTGDTNYLIHDDLVVVLENAIEHGRRDLDEVLSHIHGPLKRRDAGATRHVFHTDG